MKLKLAFLSFLSLNAIAEEEQTMPHHKNQKQFNIICASEEEAKLIDSKLADFNNLKVPFTQQQNPILKNYVIKNNGIIIAGIKADIYHWGMMHINVLFIDENYRSQGLGTALLNRLETEAKAEGATLIHLNSFDFLAYDFYLKHGYEILGVLDDCPKGHKRYYLKKNLLCFPSFNTIAEKKETIFYHKNQKQFDIVSASPEEAEFIDNKIDDFSNHQVPFTQKQSLILKNYVIKDNGIIIAGIKADMYYWGIVYIDVLFVDENYRGLGLGIALLNRLETDAKAEGATLIHLDSFDFQAPDFYLKHGYEIFGILEDCPPGHKRYYLKKNL